MWVEFRTAVRVECGCEGEKGVRVGTRRFSALCLHTPSLLSLSLLSVLPPPWLMLQFYFAPPVVRPLGVYQCLYRAPSPVISHNEMRLVEVSESEEVAEFASIERDYEFPSVDVKIQLPTIP